MLSVFMTEIGRHLFKLLQDYYKVQVITIDHLIYFKKKK